MKIPIRCSINVPPKRTAEREKEGEDSSLISTVPTTAAPIGAIYGTYHGATLRDRFRTHRASRVINYFRITTVRPRLVYVWKTQATSYGAILEFGPGDSEGNVGT